MAEPTRLDTKYESLATAQKNGGTDETRTRDLCRDRAAL